jgi:hypothetical protein
MDEMQRKINAYFSEYYGKEVVSRAIDHLHEMNELHISGWEAIYNHLKARKGESEAREVAYKMFLIFAKILHRHQ